MPYNSMGTVLYGKSKLLFRSLLPEGFAFFTRDPREFQIVLYTKDKIEVDLHNGSPKFWFGLKRYPRAFNVELGQIFPVIAKKDWYNCQSGDMQCLNDDLLPLYVIKSEFPAPLILGDYYVRISDPIPWAWANTFNEKNKTMPSKVMKVSIKQ
jgi:antimicrobial peptide system SdpA family protein